MRKGRLLAAILFFIFLQLVGYCQTPLRLFTPKTYSPVEFAALKGQVSKNKNIPADCEKQILVALGYFPELAATRIEFRFKHSNTSFDTRPALGSVFKKRSHREYIITMSDSSDAVLAPLQLKNLPYNAQIGVIAHELSHVSDFNDHHFLGLVRLGLGHLSRKQVDRFERKTDSLCIAHGLGYQLLAWSRFIRETMHTENWTGSVNIHKGPMKREKYMNPSTIQKQIERNPLYANIR
jgi:hypothetical protein